MTAAEVVSGAAPAHRVPDAPLQPPYPRGGLIDVFRHRYLLKLLVQKEVQSRYMGSLLGLMWSYIQPLVRFSMYFFVIGLVLGLHKNVPNFAVHIFCALVFIQYFNETFSSGTRSIVRNKQLVTKMAVPREMFPVASAIVSAVHIFPQLAILFVGAIASGWHPDVQGVLGGLLGASIVVVLGTALGLLFSAMNVFFRDFQNVTSTISLFYHWIVPMIYPYSKISGAIGGTWVEQLYLANPISEAVLLLQRCFWVPTWAADPSNVGRPEMPDHLYTRGLIELGVCFVILFLCQRAFTRLENRFAERL